MRGETERVRDSWPASWRRLRLADAGQWLSGGTPSTSNDAYWGGDIPWISGASMKDFHVTDSSRRLTLLGAKNGSRLAEPGTTLFVVRGMSLKSELRIGVAERQVAFGQDVKALIPVAGIDPHFLAYAIRVRTPEILSMVEETSHGTGRLDTARLKGIEIGVPSMDEQRRIVAAHAAFERRIGALERQAEKCGALVSGLVESLLRQHADQVVELGGMPVVRDSGITLGAHRAPRRNAVGYLRVANVRKGWIETGEIAALESEARDRPRYELEPGDVLVVEGHANPEQIGRAAVVDESTRGLLFQNHLFRLRFEDVIPEFAMLWLNASAVRSYWRTRCTTSSGLYTINSKLLAAVPFPRVGLEQQRKIVSAWQVANRSVDSTRRQAKRLRVLQAAVVEDLLAGSVCRQSG